MCAVHTPRVVVIQIVSMVMCMGAAYFDHKAGVAFLTNVIFLLIPLGCFVLAGRSLACDEYFISCFW